MKYFLTSLISFFAVIQVLTQTTITFRVNLEEMTQKGLFSENAGDELYVRGSFNNWNGNNFKLEKSEGSDLYTATFALENPGEKISYKYVIIKNETQAYWETNPNPANPDYGNRQLTIDKDSIVLPPAHFCYDAYFTYPVVFPEEQFKEDFIQFRNILEYTHPALYDYSSKETLDSLFDSNYNKITSQLNYRSFVKLMSEVISKVGCGHSSIFVPDKFWHVAPEKLFPLKLLISKNKTFIEGDYNNLQEIPLGSEILSINKQPIQEIVNELSSLTSADGFNSAFRQAQVARNFSVKYALNYGFPEGFTIEYTPPGSKQKQQKSVAPVSKQTIDRSMNKRPELSFRVLDEASTGLLTINTFGYYAQVEMFRAFIDSVFLEIRNTGINNLILDLRGNGGGDPFCSSYLWSYLEPEPLPYFADHYGKYDTLANPIPQAENSFKGQLFTLIDGLGFSTTGHFCGLLKYHKTGTFVGSELGSTYTCTGNAMYPPLQNTGIMVGTARVTRYTAAVKDMNPMQGVLPDYSVDITQNDIVEGKDAVMAFTLSLIKSK